MKTLFLYACFFASVVPTLADDEFLDRVDRTLAISFFDDQVRARISGLIDSEYYNFPATAAGLDSRGWL